MADAPYRKTLNDVVKDSYENSAAHGFWDDPETAETTPSKMALIHSEVSEALESYRDPESDTKVPVPSWVVESLLSEPGSTKFLDGVMELTTIYENWMAKPKGLDIELADIIIRVCDFAGRKGIDLDAAVQRKHAYNVGRPRRHGRIV